MRRCLPFLALLSLLAEGCGSEIFLGDSESPLPLAGATSTAGTPNQGGRGGAAGGSGGSATAGSGSVEPLPPGELVWSTDHEVGDFSDWERGGEFYGGEYEWGDVSGYVELGVGRDASNGVVAEINTAARNETSGGVRMYRRVEERAAYYRAWFRLEDAHRVADWWSIFLFHARDEELSLENDVSLWDVRLVNDAEGQLSLQFFDHDRMLGVSAPMGRGAVSPGQWFELSAYLDYRPPNATRLIIWQGDTLLFDEMSLRTPLETNVFWSVGNGAGDLSPADSTLYLDDAEVRGTAP